MNGKAFITKILLLGGLFEDKAAFEMFRKQMSNLIGITEENITRPSKPSLSVVLGAINYIIPKDTPKPEPFPKPPKPIFPISTTLSAYAFGFKYTDEFTDAFTKFSKNSYTLIEQNGKKFVNDCVEIFLERGQEVSNVTTTVVMSRPFQIGI